MSAQENTQENTQDEFKMIITPPNDVCIKNFVKDLIIHIEETLPMQQIKYPKPYSFELFQEQILILEIIQEKIRQHLLPSSAVSSFIFKTHYELQTMLEIARTVHFEIIPQRKQIQQVMEYNNSFKGSTISPMDLVVDVKNTLKLITNFWLDDDNSKTNTNTNTNSNFVLVNMICNDIYLNSTKLPMLPFERIKRGELYPMFVTDSDSKSVSSNKYNECIWCYSTSCDNVQDKLQNNNKQNNNNQINNDQINNNQQSGGKENDKSNLTVEEQKSLKFIRLQKEVITRLLKDLSQYEIDKKMFRIINGSVKINGLIKFVDMWYDDNSYDDEFVSVICRDIYEQIECEKQTKIQHQTKI